MTKKTCLACAYCYCEPDDDFTCGHPDAGIMGAYIRRAAAPGGHCGPNLPKFKQHPMRNRDGSLKREALLCLIQLDRKDTVKTRRELLALHSQALSISSKRSQ